MTLRRVGETLSDDILAKMGALEAAKAQADVPVVTAEELAEADAVLFGTPTRFGNMTAQMRQFLDSTGGLWMKGAPGRQARRSVRVQRDPARRAGIDDPVLSHPICLHQGMVVVGLPYAFQGQMRIDEITGGSPYGASTIAVATAPVSPRRTSLRSTLPGQAPGRNRFEAQGLKAAADMNRPRASSDRGVFFSPGACRVETASVQRRAA